MNTVYENGVATITTTTRETRINVPVTASLALTGDLGRPSATDVRALAAGYVAMVGENKKLREELRVARTAAGITRLLKGASS